MKAGWQAKTLEEVCQFSNGLWKGEKPPFVNVGVIRNTNFTKEGALDDSDIAYLDVEAKKFEKRRLEFGDIILEKSGGGPKQPVGRVVLFDKTEGDFSFSNFTAALRVLDSHELDFRFLHKFLYWTHLSGVTEGMQSHSTGIRNLDNDAYKAIKISFPALPEQQRIVGILDDAFDGIATAKANAEKNLQNARALFESHLQSVFIQRGEEWEQKRMVELCSIITCGVASTPKYVDEAVGIPFLSAQNVKDGEVSLKKYRFISKDFHEKLTKNNKPTTGDILYSRVGAKYGEAAVVEHDFEFSVYVSLTLIRPIATKLDSYFLKYYLNSPSIKRLAKKSISSSGVPNLNVKDVREFPVSYPSIEKQRQIVNEIKLLNEETQRLARLYERKLAALDKLKKSLLHQAFSGAL